MVPFNRPYLTGNEATYIGQALTAAHLSGDGPFTARATQLLTGIIGAPAALLTTSCTHALDMSALLLDLRPGDEVILPSFTFCSSASAYCLRGAVPVFVDCRQDTLNINEKLIEAAITERTKAIVVVHYAGIACDMEKIGELARRHDLAVIEDNAHGLGGTFQGRQLGSFGVMATQSFHETKNVQCGEGGALVLNDAGLGERAEIIREKGTNRSQFFRGQVDKYRWVDIGSSYLPSEILAAFLTAQLESFDDIQRQRMAIWDTYQGGLADWASANETVQPTIPPDCEHPAHLYYLLLPDLRRRQAFIRHLAERGVHATFHYQPLHASPAGERLGRTSVDGCRVTEDVADRLVRLPLFAGMVAEDLGRVMDAVQSYDIGDIGAEG